MSDRGTRQTLVVALGASNTAGYGVGVENAFPHVLEQLLRARGVEAKVLNSGMSGNTTGQMLARLDEAVPAGTKVVVLQPGSNDARLGISETVREQNITMIVAALRKRDIGVVRVAAAFEAVRHGNLQTDGIHYTEAGHALIAGRLVDDVARALRT